ncbi:hypothetical protein M5689_010820 [Euphorbia peplus]|nr:hypothetical protein M5689_010820 [Euphorbia peplus]
MKKLLCEAIELTLDGQYSPRLLLQSEAMVVERLIKRWSLSGRLVTNHTVRVYNMQNVLADLWKPRKCVFMEELGLNLFRFDFGHPWERDRVVNGSSWTYEQHLLLLLKVADGKVGGDEILSNADFWVQKHDLPVGYVLEKVA